MRLVCGLLLFLAAALEGKRLPVRAYATADGLAHNFASSIFQDSHGFLWCCTIDGLSLFDGYQFTNFGLDQGLPGRLSKNC